MIIKSHEVSKINLNKNLFVLMYGKNDGLKVDIINKLTKNKPNIFYYDEKEIIENLDNFINELFSGSLFENEKIYRIKRATDKLTKIPLIIKEKKPEGIKIFFEDEILEKKSKLRSFFEKDKDNICIPIYADNYQTLSKIAKLFIRENKISLSSSNINMIIEKCNGDRNILVSELNKLKYFFKNGKKVNNEIISKLTNLIENHNISELVDNYLINNKHKIIKILNENNYTNEDCILINRTLLYKSKKILKLSQEYEKNNNIDLTISSAKPPIFWKDKEITKQQLLKWKPNNLINLIYKISEIELVCKKNINNSLNVIYDFLLMHDKINTNNWY